MKDLIPVYKPIGKTPLQCVEEFKQTHSKYKDVTVSYAGRLDPMAEGVLLLLVGEANKKRREYEHLDKEYEVAILCGVATDTGDLMGKIVQIQNIKSKIQNDKILETLKYYSGRIEQRYPAYSSAKVNGKPLYWWARRGRLHEITIPTHNVEIHSISLQSIRHITAPTLLEYVVDNVSKVQGDFRQVEIIQRWREIHSNHHGQRFPILNIKVACGSGAYMRVLAEDIGDKLGLPACAYAIKRTRVGIYMNTL